MNSTAAAAATVAKAAPVAAREMADAAAKLYPVSDVLALGFSHYIIIIFSVIAIAWGSFMASRVSDCHVD
jgi:hypothetical protein